MRRASKLQSLMIHINLVLWLVLLGQTAPESASGDAMSLWRGEVGVSKSLVLGGFVFSVAWTYYAVYRKAKQEPVKPGHCLCGYDLRGNESGTCPECGRETSHAGP